jgi:REP element-mobilizing transposase RayT
MKRVRHFSKRPPHIYLDNQIYFITVRTYRGLHFLRPEKYKTILLEVIKEKINKYNCSGAAGFSLPITLKRDAPGKNGVTDFSLSEQPKGCYSNCVDFDNFKFYAFAILDNHYHLLIKITRGLLLPKFIGEINGKSSRLINTEDTSIDQKIWANYFDKCIKNETDFYKHLNYIHQNPIKHGNVFSLDELKNYKFCSYGHWLKEKGEEFLTDCFRKYPIVDFVIKGDEF